MCTKYRRQGSIPALTGKPVTTASCGCASKVYPRAYGETQPAENPIAAAGGLSPRLRGNLERRRHGEHRVGSIPALTGKPHPGLPAGCRAAVYPRAYGETQRRPRGAAGVWGLSPRLRGNRGGRRRREGAAGSIPALTGKPPPGCRPRAICAGLSPRLRGNPPPPEPPHRPRGSIPALTGKPNPRSGPAVPTAVYPRAYGETMRVGGLA